MLERHYSKLKPKMMYRILGGYAQKEVKAQEAEGTVVDDLRNQNEALQEQVAQLTTVIAGLNDTIKALTSGGGKGASKNGGGKK